VSSGRVQWGALASGISSGVLNVEGELVYLAVAGERGAWTFKVWTNLPLVVIASGGAQTKLAARDLAEVAALVYADTVEGLPASRPDDGDRFDSDPLQRPDRWLHRGGKGGAE
jgi:hypothetical protein